MAITEPPIMAMARHCRGCQRLTSGPYSLTPMLAKSGFSVEGATEIGVLHKPEMQHHFCVSCKNWVYSDGERIAGLVNFRATMLDDASWLSRSWTPISAKNRRASSAAPSPLFRAFHNLKIAPR
jgi:hypothetical protein